MAKLTAPKPEYVQIDSESNMVFSAQHAGGIYTFLQEIETLYNRYVGLNDDPDSSPFSYLEYLMLKLKMKQSFGMAGEYLYLHVSSVHLDSFLERMKSETRWRIANGNDVPDRSWLIKGGMITLPDARGVFLRAYSDNIESRDPDGYKRTLGAYQDSAQQKWSFNNSPRHQEHSMGGCVQEYDSGSKSASPIHDKKSYKAWTVSNSFSTRTSTEDRPRNITALVLILT